MNILLTGMPASGKTTAAIALKELFQNYAIVDIDAEIVKLENMSINDIFSQSGEEYFRKIETRVLKEVLKKDNQIIASGGGIVKSCENMRIIKENSVSIYLKSDLETLAARAAKSTERPLLSGNTDGRNEASPVSESSNDDSVSGGMTADFRQTAECCLTPKIQDGLSTKHFQDKSRDGGIKLKLKDMLKERREKYEQADIIIDTQGLTPEQTAKEITEKINEYNKRKN